MLLQHQDFSSDKQQYNVCVFVAGTSASCVTKRCDCSSIHQNKPGASFDIDSSVSSYYVQLQSPELSFD